jgi:hemoglobin
MKPDIKDINDIVVFVDDFYGKVRQDNLIGPIFDNVIKDWGPHLEKMYAFWNAALFGVPGFRGNPFAKHAPLPVDETHFERWLSLFGETIEQHFEGPVADNARNRAELMAFMFMSRLRDMKGGFDKVVV